MLDKDGWTNQPSITIKKHQTIQHAKMAKTRAIVLHRTGQTLALCFKSL